jgi:hypothetical protein
MKTYEVKKHLSTLITHRERYFDRVHLWLDTDRRVFSQAEEQAIRDSTQGTGEVRAEFLFKPMDICQPHFKCKIELHQPTRETFQLLDDKIAQAGCGYVINYVEVAADFNTGTWEKADQLHEFIRRSLVYRAGTQYPFDIRSGTDPARLGSTYFNDLYKPRSITPVFYSDRLKISGKPVGHLEYRLDGSGNCERYHLTTLKQLMNYDMRGFFQKLVEFRKMPSKYDIGLALTKAEARRQAKFKAGMSDAPEAQKSRWAYEMRCNRFLAKQGIDYDTVPLQRLLSWVPEAGASLMEKSRTYHDTVMNVLFGK